MTNQNTGGSGQLTRRDALSRFATLAGIAYVGTTAVVPATADAQAAGLGVERRAVLETLCHVYDQRPGSAVDTSQADVIAIVEAAYLAGTEQYRTWVDALLDAADAVPANQRLRHLGPGAARAEVRSWLGPQTAADRRMFEPRPTDDAEPSGIRESNARMRTTMKAFVSRKSAEELALDPSTDLPAFASMSSGRHIDPLPPIDPEIRLKRALRVSTYRLFSALLTDDRYGIDEVVL